MIVYWLKNLLLPMTLPLAIGLQRVEHKLGCPNVPHSPPAKVLYWGLYPVFVADEALLPVELQMDLEAWTAPDQCVKEKL